MQKQKQLIPKTISIEDAQKIVDEERILRATEVSEKINELLKQNNCEIHYDFQYSSQVGKVGFRFLVVAK
jgi:uncharacterized protein (UPF0276 family)